MSKVEARIKLKGKQYEIHVDLDEALKVKEGAGNISAALDSPNIYYDLHKGTLASKNDLEDAFKTTDTYEIAKIIITKGEVQKTQEFRDEEREKKIKQVISLLLKNAVDQHGHPFTEERLKSAIQDSHFKFDSRPPEQQMTDLVHKLKEIIPIKIETKRVKLIIPAQFTGQVYGLLKDYKEREDWLSNGNLEVIMNIPSGLLIDFFEKINAKTHGAIQSEELAQE
jgi:ribosome maturation protein SDO1